MKQMSYHFVCIALTLLIMSCGTTGKIKRPLLKTSEIILSKSVTVRKHSADPVDPSSVFSTFDKEVVAVLQLANVSGIYNLRWDWFDPNGKLYTSSGDFPIKTSDTKMKKQVSAWHKITLKGDPAERIPGHWQVKLNINGRLSDVKTFEVVAKSDLIPLPSHLAQEQNLSNWGLIIGIEEYAHLPHVQYAKKDALIVKDYFTKLLGVPNENIIMLIDQDATKARIEGYIQQYIPANVQKNSTLYVYFAGHGAPDIKKSAPYLIPYDGDTRFLHQTGYNLKSFYRDIGKLKVKRSYLFLDSCFSGIASRTAEMLTKGSRPALIHVKGIQAKSKNFICLSASSAGQTSNAYPDRQHGLFTYYLLKGLSGAADQNANNYISMKEVFSYVSKNVSRVARRMGLEQTPVITPPINKLKDFAIKKVIQ